MRSEPWEQKCSWSRCEPLQNKNHPDVFNMLYFKQALLSPQLALQQEARWKAEVTKTICLKDNFRKINQSEHPAPWAESTHSPSCHPQPLPDFPITPETSATSAREESKHLPCSGTDGGTHTRVSSEWEQARVTPLPSVKLPVRVMTTNTLPSGSKSTWKKGKEMLED